MEKCIKLVKFLFLLMSICLSSNAQEVFDFYVTNDKDVEAKLIFLENLSTCTPYKYHAVPSGIYEVKGKQNTYCNVKWTIVNCTFPNGVYQKFANVQKFRTMERLNRQRNGVMEELRDKNYRYLINTGNLYCQNDYSFVR